MSRYRRAAKVDANQASIVAALRQLPGVTVATGHDDILVGYRGLTFWFEIKRPSQKSRLQESQEYLRATWAGHYAVATSFEDVWLAINTHGKAG